MTITREELLQSLSERAVDGPAPASPAPTPPTPRQALLNSLHQRAMGGCLKSARLCLAEPRRIRVESSDEGAAPSRYDVWTSLCKGQISIADARELIDVLRHL